MKVYIKAKVYLLLIVLAFTLINGCKKDEITPKKDVIITWNNPEDIAYGALLDIVQLNAIADVPGAFVYAPKIGTKLEIGANQDLKVNFKPTDTITYNLASKTVKINVFQGKMTDQEGNEYKTIIIGTQTWMAENLKTTKYRNGDPIELVTDETAWSHLSTGAYCWNNNNLANKAVQGALYNWYAVSDSRNICPKGWHIPTDEEWTILTDYLANNKYGFQESGDDIAKSMASQSGWTDDSNAGNIGNDQTSNNSSGFNATPGGRREPEGTFYGLGLNGYWWSSTQSSDSDAYYRTLASKVSTIGRSGNPKTRGFSVRCIKD